MNGYKIVLLKAIFMLYKLLESERVCSGICTHQNSQIKIRRNIKHKKQSQLNLNDSILNLFDVDIDLALGDISLDATWGDPVVSPQIRCNKASNLFGPVRHNADGSIRWHRGFDYYAPKGTPIMAVGEGVISLIQENHPGYGLCILITHNSSLKISLA